MSFVRKLNQAADAVKAVNKSTRHANLLISAGMYYDHVRPPSRCSWQTERETRLDTDHWDYVRFRTLDLLAEEIRGKEVEGALAEAGVFQGDFARAMSTLLPDKKIYLFDTFAGFSEDDLREENAAGRASDAFIELATQYKDTSVEEVLSSMPSREQCIVCAGYFSTASQKVDEHERFCLVSIDMDFYQPTYDALCFFYPRLVPCGYLLVHDYNHDELHGVKEAVACFRKSYPSACCIPVADQCGTLIIAR